ncbi:tetratricopeptide repeat protein [Camelliibacillus cellulosilyticus]|uniref:Tetratricopeptide repeat protein n=1 Tax=Camelliibacillus cellulosilyticus TaxID=2174486 RepID=A0ABV9GHQ7_9BACL
MDDLSLAVQLVETGQYEAGLAKIKAILSEADDETAYQIATLYSEWGLAEEAFHILKNLHRSHPSDSNILLILAETAIDLDKEDDAIGWLAQIHRLDDNYLSAQVLLADLYQAQGLEEAAENRLLAARKMAPHEPVLAFALGEFYLSTGKPQQALSFYQEVLHAETLSHENIHLKLAEALSMSGRFEEAMIHYRKGLDREKTLDGLFGYAVTAIRIEKYQTAISALEELKALDPQYSTLYPLLAEAYLHEGANDEALEVLEAGMKIDDFNERLFLDAADVAVKNGDPAMAETYLERLLEKNPEQTEGLKKLVELKREREAYTDVIRLLGEEAAIDPELRWYLAKAYQEEEELPQALEQYEASYAHYRKDPDFLADFGEALWQAGERDKASKILRESLNVDPENHQLREFVERIEQDF